MIEIVEPIEVTDPLISELFLDVSNKKYDRFNVKYIRVSDTKILLVPYKNYHIGGRNEICKSGSNLKIKKCHCMDLFN